MKFNCGLSKEEKQRRELARLVEESEWHDVFAWFPVRVGEGDCRWLETIEARRVLEYYTNTDVVMTTLTKYLDKWEVRAKTYSEVPKDL